MPDILVRDLDDRTLELLKAQALARDRVTNLPATNRAIDDRMRTDFPRF